MQHQHPQNTLRISSSTRSICCIAQCEQSGEHEETIAEPELQGIKDLKIQRWLGNRWKGSPWQSGCQSVLLFRFWAFLVPLAFQDFFQWLQNNFLARKYNCLHSFKTLKTCGAQCWVGSPHSMVLDLSSISEEAVNTSRGSA